MCENTMRFVPSDANVKLNKEKKEQSSSENEVGKYESWYWRRQERTLFECLQALSLFLEIWVYRTQVCEENPDGTKRFWNI